MKEYLEDKIEKINEEIIHRAGDVQEMTLVMKLKAQREIVKQILAELRVGFIK